MKKDPWRGRNPPTGGDYQLDARRVVMFKCSPILRDKVLPCLACDTCHRKGRCAQNDEFESIKGKILEADGLVLASPNYIFSVSAQLKAFMDRCCGVVHCMAFEGKYGVSVVTSGGGEVMGKCWGLVLRGALLRERSEILFPNTIPNMDARINDNLK
jgi:multimeric flavodoxin WrbA